MPVWFETGARYNIMEFIRFINAKIIQPDAIVENDLWICNGKVIDSQPSASKTIDLQGHYIAPGYIDLQINGAFGLDFSKNPENISAVSKMLPRYGVTSFMPTFISNTPENYRTLIKPLRNKEGGSIPLGYHLEGPFLNRIYAGAHDPNLLIDEISEIRFNDCYGSLKEVKLS